ncbi:phosphatase [Fibrobacterales bacterium]|nr:phosphatase [Fibrobacterales bacterium]
MKIDLHLHTIHSDGMLSVEKVLQLAKSKNIGCVSITDHDTFAAYNEAPKIAAELELELITGIELSATYNEKDIHILGYFCDTNNTEFLQALKVQHNHRKERVKESLEKLQNFGHKILYSQVEKYCSGNCIGRPHIARAMLEQKIVSTFAEAFDKYLGDKKLAYSPLRGFTPQEAINYIKISGGIAVMAHPEYTDCDYLIPDLVKWGIEGIEVYNYKTKSSVQKYKNVAQKYNLAITGGSDFHAENCGLFGFDLPYSLVSALRERKKF